MDALKVVKRISNTQFSQYPNSFAARRAKAQISKSIDKLVQSMRVDVNIVLKEMLEETDERKQLQNVDFIFRVCIPLYFLSDVRSRSGSETSMIQDLLRSTKYQILIRRGLGKDNSTKTLNEVIQKFLDDPNDLRNNRELSQIERIFNVRDNELDNPIRTDEI